MVFSATQKKPTRFLLYSIGVITIILILWPMRYVRGTAREDDGRAWDNLHVINNETLGVQKVFAINLPSRSDKRDAIALGSSVSAFDVEWIDGVTPDQIDSKTHPYNWNNDHSPTEYAARRAHMNGMQRIVKERIESAIIMEDDADWDVSIKTQLQSFALASRDLQAFQGTTDHARKGSPYGHDWDILWLGHCGIECRTDLPFFLTPGDPTVVPTQHFLPYWREPPPIERPDHTRLTCSAGDGVCSLFYAVSYRGAQRILSALSANPSGIAEEIDIGAQFDVSLGRMCGRGYLRCFAPYPALTGGYRSAGSPMKSSDIHNGDGYIEGNIEGPFSYGVMYSTMLNINRILSGNDTVHSTWDDVAIPDINPDDIPVLGGTIQMLGEGM